MQTSTSNAKREKRAARTRADWATEVRRWRESGQRCGQYARAHDLHPGTLSYWASRLKQESGVKPSRVSKARRRFVPVRVVEGMRSAPTELSAELAGQFEVVLSNGRAVRVTGSFHSEALSRLLTIVEGTKTC